MTTYELGSCPACGGRRQQRARDASQLRSEVEALWEREANADPPTPLDRLLDRVAFTQPPPLQLVRCADCGLLFRNPREHAVRRLYEEEDVPEATLAALFDAQRPAFGVLAHRLARIAGGTGSVLEVGSYSGAFLAAAGERGWDAEGVDVSAAAVRFCASRGLAVQHGGIEDASAAARYDAVAIWNCFDQLDDPVAAARTARARLRRGGVLALRVPNGAFYLALADRLGGPAGPLARALLARHNFLGFPYRHGFTRAALRRLLTRARFQIVRLRGTGVLPSGRPPKARDRLLDAAERLLRSATGPPWLELYARRSS